ncbi:MAG: TraK domain-containing protein [Candidatus Nitrospinota bacterium M3_3B_026]
MIRPIHKSSPRALAAAVFLILPLMFSSAAAESPGDNIAASPVTADKDGSLPSSPRPDRTPGREGSGIRPAPAGSGPVTPETVERIRLSSTDVNRIVCGAGDITDVVFSQEKGVNVKVAGRDAFVKFLVKRKPGGKLEYSETPSELFVVCGGKTYTLIALPGRIPSRTVRLSTGAAARVDGNRALLGALPFEKKILEIVRYMYTGGYPDSFTVREEGGLLVLSGPEYDVRLVRTVDVEGEGLRALEYEVAVKRDGLELSERDFLHPALSERPLSIALDGPGATSGRTRRLFVVERRFAR